MSKLTYSACFSENLTMGRTEHKRNLGGGGEHENTCYCIRGATFFYLTCDLRGGGAKL